MGNILLHLDTYGANRASETMRDLRWKPSADLVVKALAEDLYVAVATFDVDDPEAVWTATQNGVASPSWSRSPPQGVSPLGAGTLPTSRGSMGYRSSDLGDLLMVDDVLKVVSGIGFEDVEVDLPEAVRTIDGGTLAIRPAPRP